MKERERERGSAQAELHRKGPCPRASKGRGAVLEGQNPPASAPTALCMRAQGEDWEGRAA